MTPLVLSHGTALAIIAFLLSLLPAGFFIWLLYLRRRDQSTPAGAISTAFITGIFLVLPAFWFEDFSERIWRLMSPSTVHNFAGPLLPLQSIWDIVLPAIGTFVIVATVEEGLRYLALRVWLRKSKALNQVFDGLLIGVATGLGFATLENTIYFLQLFQQGSYDTLVFVFFLRFMISTLAHVAFSGIMGALLARGLFDVYNSKRFMYQAFIVPWILHGLYDLLLGINHGLYAVLLLLPPLLVLMQWTQRHDFFTIHRKNGKFLEAAVSATKVESAEPSPWNSNAPWLNGLRSYNKMMKRTQKYAR